MADLRPAVTVPEAEQAAWLTAMQRFSERVERDDFTAVESFLQHFPQGMWASPLRVRLAEELYLTGHYRRAVQMLEEVWQGRGKPAAPGNGVVYARAGAKLAELYARLGRVEDVQRMVAELEPLRLGPADTEILRSIQQGRATMQTHPEKAFRCGALALERLRVHDQSTNAGHRAILSSRSTSQGMSLADLAALSAELGMNYKPCFRNPGAALMTPCVMHLTLGHFVAVVRERKGKVQIEDPTGWQTTFASLSTVDDEASGYFLVPPGDLPAGWRRVDGAEAATIWGRNGVLDNDPDAAGKRDARLTCGGNEGRSAASGPLSHGLATYDVHLMLVSQQIIDTPVGYAPPFGPPVYVTLRHTQRSNERFGYRPTWTHSWSGELYEDPRTPLGDLWLQDEGGWERFSPMDEEGTVYQGRVFNVGRLIRTAPTEIAWVFPDGTQRIYATSAPTNVVWARIFYLTGIQDASGNRVSIQVLPSGRVESLTDPLGQVTRFFYELADPGVPPTVDPVNAPVTVNSDYTNQVTRVVDPFGRVALLQYAKVERYVSGFCDGGACEFGYYNYDLTNITDVAGMSSQFAYDGSGQVVSQLTTPYGTTSFNWTNSFAGDYALDITDPEGSTERVEFGAYYPGNPLWQLPRGMQAASEELGPTVAHWSKKAYAEAYSPRSTLGPTLYSFHLNETFLSAGRVLQCVQQPLENRVWFNYPGQGYPTLPGIGDQPTRIGRVLDDGSTQLWQMDRDPWGNIIRSVDPLGRTFSYVYAANFLDLLEVRQTRAGNNELLMRAEYDDRHHPTAVTDAAGQTTRYTYNARGQVTRVVNPLGQATDLTYDPAGYLVAVDGPLPGPQDRDTFAYDAVGRLQSVVDSDGYRVTIEYDALDRATRLTFPDGTTREITYDRMEVGAIRDRLGRQTRYNYDALRRLVERQDALGGVTRLQWCGCGALDTLIDPLGRRTHWRRDLQGRVVAKEYVDGSAVTCEYEKNTSRLRRIRDEQGQITEFKYAPDDTLTAKRYPNALRPTPEVRFIYDPNYRRLAGMTDGDGTTTYRYYPISATPVVGAGRLAAVDGPWQQDEVTYAYDELGRIVGRAINGVTVRRSFDAAGRLSSLTNALGTFQYTWDGASVRLASLAFPNKLRAEFSYYGSEREQLLQRIRNILPNGATLSEFTYAYNAEGLITNWVKVQSGQSRNWEAGYDAADHLTRLDESLPAGATHAQVFAFDLAGNRTLAQNDADRRDFRYNAVNQLAGLSTNTPATPTAYEWDAEKRLVAITRGTKRTELSYDGMDRRTRVVEKDNGAITQNHRYLWCGPDLCEERDETGSRVLKRFSTYGVRAEIGADLPTGAYYFTRDHLQSVREMVDAVGVVRATYDYSPYGEQTKLGGDLDADFAFTGHLVHKASGLLLALYRPYDPRFARWLTRDPLGERGGMNLYAYVRGDPLNRLDRDGLQETAAASLVNQTSGYKMAKEGLDTYESAKKVGELVDSAVEKGISKAAADEVNSRLDKEAKAAFPKGAEDEAKKLNEQAGKLGHDAVDPYAKTAFGKAGNQINDALGGKCEPTKPRPLPRAPKAPPPEKSLWDKILDLVGLGSDAPPPPPPPPPDGKIPNDLLHPNMQSFEAEAARSY